MDQYFTKNITLLNEMKYLVSLDQSFESILEPSCGEEDIIKYCFPDEMEEIITCIEIDPLLKNFPNTICADFLTYKFRGPFDLIIGNPPFSLTTEFIDKCLSLLSNNGKLIMIVPERTFKLTSNIQLLSKMDNMGIFTHYVKYNNEQLFYGANVSVIIFRFVKEELKQDYLFYKVDEGEYLKMNYVVNPILNIYNKDSLHTKKFGYLFDIYVGYVCGAEKIMKIDAQSSNSCPCIKILKSQNNRECFYDFKNETDAQNSKV